MNFPCGAYLEVLNFIRQHPEGCTATQIGEAFPHLSVDDRCGISHRLRYEGYIERHYIDSRRTKWVAIR